MNRQGIVVKNRELLIYVSVLMYCVAYFMSRVKLPLSQPLIYWTMILAAFICLANVLFDARFTYKQIILSIVVGLLLLVASFPVRNFEILYLYCLIWGCRNLENDKVIKFIVWIIVTLIVITMLLGGVGVVESSVRITNVTRERYDFGYSSWTILPLQYVSTIIFLLYLKKKKIRFRDIIIPIIVGFNICVLADVKTGIVLLVTGTMGLLLCEHIKIRKWKKLYFLVAVPEMLALVSYALVKLYATGQYGILDKVNQALNNRLLYPVRGLESYGVHLLSNPEYKTVHLDSGYFGIDNAYLYMLVAWGVLATIVMLGVYSYIIYYCIREKNLRLLFITLLLVCNAVLWNRVLVLIEYVIVVCFSDAFKKNERQIEGE